jgi:hypothetical protein
MPKALRKRIIDAFLPLWASAWSATLPCLAVRITLQVKTGSDTWRPGQASVGHLHTCINVSFREQNRSQVDPLLSFQVIARLWLFGLR